MCPLPALSIRTSARKYFASRLTGQCANQRSQRFVAMIARYIVAFRIEAAGCAFLEAGS
jgi:hypothetical protein